MKQPFVHRCLKPKRLFELPHFTPTPLTAGFIFLVAIVSDEVSVSLFLICGLRVPFSPAKSQKPCTCLTSAITGRTLAPQRCSLWTWGTFGAGAIWINHRGPRNSEVYLECLVLSAASFKSTAVTSLAVKYSFDYRVVWMLPVMAECLSWPLEGLPVFYFLLLNQRGKFLTTPSCKSAVGLHVQKCKREH